MFFVFLNKYWSIQNKKLALMQHDNFDLHKMKLFFELVSSAFYFNNVHKKLI